MRKFNSPSQKIVQTLGLATGILSASFLWQVLAGKINTNSRRQDRIAVREKIKNERDIIIHLLACINRENTPTGRIKLGEYKVIGEEKFGKHNAIVAITEDGWHILIIKNKAFRIGRTPEEAEDSLKIIRAISGSRVKVVNAVSGVEDSV